MVRLEQSNWKSIEFKQWFDGYRQVQDEHADRVAARILASPHRMDVYEALASIVKNDDLITESTFQQISLRKGGDGKLSESHHSLIDLLNGYFSDNGTDKHFTISDGEKQMLAQAALFFNTRAVECTLVLAVRSLLKQYAAYNATQVLGSTRLLIDYPHRRILSTMQFVLDVMAVNAFEPEGTGIRSIQKLRLVHAMIRSRINTKSSQDEGRSTKKGDMEIDTKFWGGDIWDNEAWGRPINQQDMIFAVHTFSVEVIDGLVESGEQISHDDRENYYRAWHVIGRLLGVLPEINPDNYTDGKSMQEYIYEVQFNPKLPDGTPIVNKIAPALALPLVEFVKELVHLPSVYYVYGLIKRYNNDIDEEFFQNRMNLPLRELNRRFLWLVIFADHMQDFLFSAWSLVRYLKARSNNPKLAAKMHDVMQAVVDSQATWGTKHFRIGDGFGKEMAVEDKQLLKNGRPSLYRIVVDTFFFGKSNRPSHGH